MSDNNHFKQFAKNLELTLEQYENRTDTGRALLESQREQLKNLISLENKIRLAIIKSSKGPYIYKRFIRFICDERKNILAARPFFRERQSVFTNKISGALKKRKEKTLFKYRVNYTFVLFAMKCFKWGPNSKITKLANEIGAIRKQITELNLPLAISQARIFYASTPKSHLTWMDLVQIHCGGLLVAVDKFVPPDGILENEESLQAYRKFRVVAIGRMMSDRIENYSETSLHFYPVDKKKLYRANKLLRQFKGEPDFEQLAEMVNQDVEIKSQRTDAREIASLLRAASTVSGDTIAPNGAASGEDREMQTTIERYSTQDAGVDAYKTIEDSNSIVSMKNAIKSLPIMHKKVLKLKGVSDDNNINNSTVKPKTASNNKQTRSPRTLLN